MAEQAYVDHIISRLTSDVEFLASQGRLSQADKAQILDKLTAQPPAPSPVAQLERLSLSSGVSGRAVPPPPAPKPKLVQAEPARKLCKAVWDYPAEGSQADDLGFKAGDVITILAEENADWWRGELDGRSGLFPSNHVERLPDAVAPSPAPTPQRFVPPPPPLSHASSYSSNGPSYQNSNLNQHYGEKQPYQYEQQQQQQGPYQMQPYYQPPAPGQQPMPVVVQQEEQKKKKFGGGLGRTMANSAAGGVGFGAGAAVGSSIINSIF